MERTSLRSLLLLGALKNGGGKFETGTFTAVQQTGNVYKIEFEKPCDNYLFYAEMTAESKASLMDSGQTSAKMFAFAVLFPSPKISDDNSTKGFMAYRIVPTTGEYSHSSSNYSSADESSITITCSSYGSGSNILYINSSYNYTLIPLD